MDKKAMEKISVRRADLPDVPTLTQIRNDAHARKRPRRVYPTGFALFA